MSLNLVKEFFRILKDRDLNKLKVSLELRYFFPKNDITLLNQSVMSEPENLRLNLEELTRGLCIQHIRLVVHENQRPI